MNVMLSESITATALVMMWIKSVPDSSNYYNSSNRTDVRPFQILK